MWVILDMTTDMTAAANDSDAIFGCPASMDTSASPAHTTLSAMKNRNLIRANVRGIGNSMIDRCNIASISWATSPGIHTH